MVRAVRRAAIAVVWNASAGACSPTPSRPRCGRQQTFSPPRCLAGRLADDAPWPPSAHSRSEIARSDRTDALLVSRTTAVIGTPSNALVAAVDNYAQLVPVAGLLIPARQECSDACFKAFERQVACVLLPLDGEEIVLVLSAAVNDLVRSEPPVFASIRSRW